MEAKANTRSFGQIIWRCFFKHSEWALSFSFSILYIKLSRFHPKFFNGIFPVTREFVVWKDDRFRKTTLFLGLIWLLSIDSSQATTKFLRKILFSFEFRFRYVWAISEFYKINIGIVSSIFFLQIHWFSI